MKTRVLFAVALSVVILVVTQWDYMQPAQAQEIGKGQTYLNGQLPPGYVINSEYLNWVDYNLWSGDTDSQWNRVRWKSDPTIRASVQEAILMWTSNVPGLRFLEVASTESVYFRDTTCITDPNAFGCWTPKNYWTDPVRHATYVTRGEIKLNTSYTYSQYGRVAILSHEIGHMLGLDERYLASNYPSQGDPFGCNRNEDVIMDGMKLAVGAWVHCDDKHWPTGLDVTRTNEWWDQGKAVWLPSGSDYGVQGRFYWRDEAWTEHHWNMEYLWNSPGSPTWNLFATETWTANSGQHAFNTDRIMAKKVLPTPGRGRWYVACATPVFYGYDSNGANPGDEQLGERTCAPIVFIEYTDPDPP